MRLFICITTGVVMQHFNIHPTNLQVMGIIFCTVTAAIQDIVEVTRK